MTEYQRQFVQDGRFDRGEEDKKILAKHNLHGKDIEIGIADTGIDILSTFFYDPDHPVVYGNKTANKDHRKIVLYVPLADAEETNTKGHGTHVSNIALGKALNSSISYYNVGHS